MVTGNKTAIVTGVSSGIGFAIADACLRRGYNVVGNARTPERLRVAARLASPHQFVFLAGDISKPATSMALFDRAIECFGKVDILINSAGIFIARPTVDYSSEDLENVVDTSLRAFIYPLQRAAKHMSGNRQGHIVNITASTAMPLNVTMPALVPSLIEGGINHATRSLAIELATHNVQVNAVARAVIDTPLPPAVTIDPSRGLAPDDTRNVTQQIVDAVLYLTDSESMTGMVISIAGSVTAEAW